MEFAGACAPALQTRTDMKNNRCTYLWLAAIALLAGDVHAQSRPQPDDAAARAAPITYQSAFAGYQPFHDEPLAPWPEVNETVQRVGGHVGVLRAEQPLAAQPAATRPTASPATATPRGMGGGKPENKQPGANE
jgi:hypothetical protein